jgi:CRP/FNR family transcriptional regulator, cyclic AMP receptor protein
MDGFLGGVAQSVLHSFATPTGIVAFFATAVGLGLVVLASFVQTMVPLRTITVASNVLLFVAGALALSPVHMVLYLVLIPLNSFRLLEIKRLTRKVETASAEGDMSGLWLKPYMKPQRLRAGTALFNKGDEADSLYLVVEGELELVEIGKRQPVGELFGEISFFSPDRLRTLTARCATDCLVLRIGESAFKQLYFQHPKFAFQISNLIAHRLGADIDRLRGRLRTGGGPAS